MVNDAPTTLRGRRRECEALDSVLDDARAGQSRVLVLRGEAGIGKSALLDYVGARASACRVARTTGVESEMAFAFAGLHRICAPMLDNLDSLPGPQRDALGTIFGLTRGPAAGPVPRRPRRPRPAHRRRRRFSARVPRRRRAVARPLLGAHPGVRRPPPRCRPRRDGVRGARAHGGAAADRATRTAHRRARRRGRSRPPRLGDDRPARPARTRPRHRRVARQPARPAGAAPRDVSGGARARLRIARPTTHGEPHRAGLPAPAPARARRHPATPARRRRRAPRRRHAAMARRRPPRHRPEGGDPGRGLWA